MIISDVVVNIQHPHVCSTIGYVVKISLSKRTSFTASGERKNILKAHGTHKHVSIYQNAENLYSGNIYSYPPDGHYRPHRKNVSKPERNAKN